MKLFIFLLLLLFVPFVCAESVTRYFETNVTLVDSPWDEAVNVTVTNCSSSCSISYMRTHHNITVQTEDLNWDSRDVDNTSKSLQYKIRMARTFDTNYTNSSTETLAMQAIGLFKECEGFPCKDKVGICETEKEIMRTDLANCQKDNATFSGILDKYSSCSNDLATEKSRSTSLISIDTCTNTYVKPEKDKNNTNIFWGIAIGIGVMLLWNWNKNRQYNKKGPAERMMGGRGYPDGARDIDKEFVDSRISSANKQKAEVEEALRRNDGLVR